MNAFPPEVVYLSIFESKIELAFILVNNTVLSSDRDKTVVEGMRCFQTDQTLQIVYGRKVENNCIFIL